MSEEREKRGEKMKGDLGNCAKSVDSNFKFTELTLVSRSHEILFLRLSSLSLNRYKQNNRFH